VGGCVDGRLCEEGDVGEQILGPATPVPGLLLTLGMLREMLKWL
jgi:hypothetical protein